MFNNWKKGIGVLLISLFSIGLTLGQDPEFSMFYAAPIHLNPALTGTGKCARAIVNFRDQWPGINDARFGKSHTYQTYAASYDQFWELARGGVGGRFFGDQAGAGVISTHAFYGSYSYRLQLNDDYYLQGALEAGLQQKSLDWDRLVFADQIDARDGVVNPNSVDHQRAQESVLYPDFSAGVFVYGEKYYGGAAVKHITQPNQSFKGGEARLPMRVTVHGGGVFHLQPGYENSSYISTDILYTHQRQFRQFNVGAFWSNDMFYAGVWGRFAFGKNNLGDAIIPRVGFQKDFYKINYSYDYTLSSLNNVGQFNVGAHEIALQFNICSKERNTSLYCPRLN